MLTTALEFRLSSLLLLALVAALHICHSSRSHIGTHGGEKPNGISDKFMSGTLGSLDPPHSHESLGAFTVAYQAHDC